MSYKVINSTEIVTESGYIESNCLSISFKIKDGSLGAVEIDSFPLLDGDPMYSLSCDYPGQDVTKYFVRFTTPGVLYVIRKLVVSENNTANPGSKLSQNFNC